MVQFYNRIGTRAAWYPPQMTVDPQLSVSTRLATRRGPPGAADAPAQGADQAPRKRGRCSADTACREAMVTNEKHAV